MADPTYALGTVVAGDGYPLAYRKYPAAQPGGVVLACIHGIQSHAGWYENCCRFFADAGIETFFFDRRGSGANQADRGHARGPAQLMDDLERCLAMVRERHPNAKVALLGISWGGKLALAAAGRKPDLADALIFLCPGWFARVSPSLREKLAIGWSTWLWPRRRINIPLNDPRLFTADPDKQRFIADDPLALRQATARLLFTSRLIESRLPEAAQQIRVPCLLVLAGQDRIIDNAKTTALFNRFATPNKKVLEYPEAHHTLEFEADAVRIFGDVREWLMGIAAHVPFSRLG